MQSSPIWRFGPFSVDPDEQTLARAGEPVLLTRMAFRLLLTLIARPGKLCTKHELFDTVWAGRIVSDAALSRVVHELRRALGDDANAPRYIATVHGVGFRFLADVVAVSPSVVASDAAAATPETSATSKLIGREREFQRLDVALAEAHAGRRQLITVTGEAGIGKTALVQSFIEQHRTDTELLIAQGQCIEQYGTAEAYLPILEVLEQLAQHIGNAVLAAVLRRFAPAWLSMLPWLAQEAGSTDVAGPWSDLSAQRMLRELAQALEVLSAERTILLWLEDLHWSDPSSLDVVAMLAGRRETARLLLVCSYRPTEAKERASPLDSLTLRLAQRRQASELALNPLGTAAVEQYLRSRFGGSDDRLQLPVVALSAFIHRRSDGNPLFAVAMVDDLVGRGMLELADGEWSFAGNVDELGDVLPDDLRRLVHDQVDRLAVADRRMIEAAAVVGTDFAAAAVAAALQAEPLDTEDRCARLAELGRLLRLRAPVIWPDGTSSAGFGFRHAMIWQAILGRVPQGRRAEWQMRIALRQEQAFGAQSGLVASELAMRFESARDLPRALHYLRVAGGAALTRCAYTESTAILQHALALVPGLEPTARARAELDILLPLGAALMATRGYAADDVDRTYQRALALCDECGRPGERERAMRGLWNIAFLRSDLRFAHELASQLLVLAEASGADELIFDARTKLGQTCVHLPELRAAFEHLQEARALPTVSERVRARALPRIAVYEAWFHWYSGYPTQAREAAEQALRSAGASDSPHSSAFAFGYAGWIYQLCGDAVRAEALARAGALLSAEHAIPYWQAMCEYLHGRAVADLGDVARGIDEMRAAIASMRLGGARVGLPYLHCGLAETEMRAGRIEDAEATLAAGVESASADNALYAAELHRLRGLLAIARSTLAPERQRDNHRAAERNLLGACELAQRQGARSLELRAATDLAAHWTGNGLTAQAKAVLTPLFDAFTEGFDTIDVDRARQLLDTLTG